MKFDDTISAIVAVWIGLMGCLAIAEKLGRGKFQAYLNKHESDRINMLHPRPVGLIIRTVFGGFAGTAAVACGSGGSWNFTLVFSIGALFFLVPTVSLMFTKVYYDDEFLVITRPWKQQFIPLDGLRSVELGCSSLSSKGQWIKIQFSSGRTITFEQIDYLGIPAMYKYLQRMLH